jgi:putative tryptophan/tyrosine transport system substrate-binding protein
VRRREFITVLGGAAAWPHAAGAQQDERVRRIGVLMNLSSDDREGQARVTASRDGLQQSGWIEGRNAHLDIRWAAGEADRFRMLAKELVALAPDIILAGSGTAMPPLLQATRTIPIVFVQVADPVGNGFVASLARPEGNATGFTNIDFAMSAKWLELLKEIAPQTTRAMVLRDATEPSGIGQWAALQSIAPSLGVELIPGGVRDPGEIERGVKTLASKPNGGLIVTASAPTAVHRTQIIALAAQYRLPAVYAFKYHATSGGLISYGPETIDPYRRAAAYADRILKGENPGDLPVQVPTKYELVINLKTAKALGITVPPSLLARAEEVIE